ncbi:MAG: dihydrofolate reductase, partial [Armatimonadota bacterium]
GFLAVGETYDLTGHDVAMSRGMWEALPDKFRPLPGRGNIIVTSQRDYTITKAYREQGVRIALSTAQAKEMTTAAKLFFAGGQDLWYGARDHVDVLLINEIDSDVLIPQGVEGVLFPHLLDPTKLWPEFVRESEKRQTDDKAGFPVKFRRYIRQ